MFMSLDLGYRRPGTWQRPDMREGTPRSEPVGAAGAAGYRRSNGLPENGTGGHGYPHRGRL